MYVLVHTHECKNPWRAEKGIGSLGNGAIGGSELSNTGVLEEQQSPLPTEPSFQTIF